MTKFGALAKVSDQARKVLNLYDEYILGPRDLSQEAKVLGWILTKNADRVQTGQRDRRNTWSASSAGKCLRAQQFTFLGFPERVTSEDLQNIFMNGDYLHLRYQMAGVIAGWLKDVEVPLTYGQRVRGTMDGDLAWGEVLELKSINDWGYRQVADLGPKEPHKLQATAYMLATGYTSTRFVYENKNNNLNVEFVFELDDAYVKRVTEDWDRLDWLADRRKLAPMLHDCLNERGFDWKYCPFSPVCEKARYPIVTG
jgi:hypothetical protein